MSHFGYRANPALNLAPYGRWTLRDIAAQRRLALREAIKAGGTRIMCNTGSSDITLPSLEMRQPDEGDGYLVVARDLFQGVEALSTHESVPPRACALIAAHALECILKGYLWRKGKRAELRHKDNRHNILALWDLSYKEQTLGISENPPAWV